MDREKNAREFFSPLALLRKISFITILNVNMAELVRWIEAGDSALIFQGLDIELQVLKEQRDKQLLLFLLIASSAVVYNENKEPHRYNIFTDLLEVYRTNVTEFDAKPWFTEILEFFRSYNIPLIYTLGNISYLQVALELARRDDIQAYTLFSILNKVLPNQPVDMYIQVYNYALELESHRYTESFEPLLRQQILERMEAIEKPDYVLDKFLPEVEEDVTIIGTTSNPLLLSSAVNYLGLGMNREQAAEKVQNYLDSYPDAPPLTENIMKIVGRYQLTYDEELFRRYGPVNTLVNDRLDIDHKCSNYGGCRMFLCTCFEGNKYLDFEACEPDWFHQVCQWDMKIIPSRAWAWRIPLPIGGWKGCYCSVECALNDCSTVVEPYMGEDNTNLTPEQVEDRYATLTLVTRSSLNVIKSEMKRLGVYDRKEEFVEPEPVLKRHPVYKSGEDESGLSLPPDVENESLRSQIYTGYTTLLSSARAGENATEREAKLNDLTVTDYLERGY